MTPHPLFPQYTTGRKIKVTLCPPGTVFLNASGERLLQRVGLGQMDFRFVDDGDRIEEPYSPEVMRIEMVPISGDNAMLLSAKNFVKKHERYLVMAAALLIIDQFILKGAMRGRIFKLATTVAERCAKVLDQAIASIGGE